MLLRSLIAAAYACVVSLALITQIAFLDRKPTEEAAPGSDGDLDARARYEFEKLKDPRTGEIPANIRERELAFARTLPSRSMQTFAFKGLASKPIDWKFRGPDNLGGRTRALAVDVSDPNVVIAGGVSGGMWRSEDKGNSWSRTSKLSDLKSVTCLAQDTRVGHTNTWYYGTGEARANSAGLKAEYYGDGLSKSTDGGRTWRQLEATLSRTPQRFDDFDYIIDLAIDRSNMAEDEVYCSTTRSVYRSINGGDTWDLVLGGGQGGYCSVYATSTGVMYAAIHSNSTSAGIYRSTDGLKWTNITPTELGLVFERVVIRTAPSDESQVYMLLSTPGTGLNGNTFLKYTYVKGDGIGTDGVWENRTSFLPAAMQTYYSYCMTLEINEANPNIVYLGGMDLYRSTNGFASSSKTYRIGGNEYEGHHADQHVLAHVPGKLNAYYSGSDGGVHLTEDINASNVKWTNCNHGYISSQFYTVTVDHENNGSDLVMGGLQDNGTWISKTGTNAWQNVWNADGGYGKIIDGGSTVYASWQNGVIYRLSRDENGFVENWTRIDPSSAWNYEFINPFAVDPNDANRMYVTEGQSIWRTTEALSIENGANGPATSGWTRFSGALNQQVTALSVSRRPADVLYYGTKSGTLYRMNDANLAGSKPVNISSGKGLPGGYVSAISIDPYNADRVLVSYSNYGIQSLAYTTDAGDTWSMVGGNLEEKPDGSGAGPAVKWVATLPAKSSTLYFAGTTTGLYSTEKLDGANTVWMLEAENVIGNTVVDMIDVRHTDGFVAVATHGNGVYSAKIDIEGGPVGDVAVAPSPSVGLNVSPNPSNSFTRIGFELHDFSPVDINIVDLSGKIVFSHHDRLPAGTHAVKWNGLDQLNRALPSGTYMIHLRTPFAEDRKTIVRVK
jgi:hypothetical protein